MIPFRKKRERLEKQVQEVKKEKEEVQQRTAKIDELAEDLRTHLKQNNFGQRIYNQWVQSWR